MNTFYFDVLYPFQDKALATLKETETGFYLTGGTASSRGYLNHRFSDDLDFFVNDDSRFRLWVSRIIQGLDRPDDWQLKILLNEERFARILLSRDDVTLKMEFVNDVPAHVGKIRFHPILGRLDSPENIVANKITALVDREEPKDLADIWGFCCLKGLSLMDAIVGGQSKAAGIFPLDIARILCSASTEDWELIRWIEAPAAEKFISELHELGEKLILNEQDSPDSQTT